MKRLICVLLAALALATTQAKAQNDWPQDSVRKSLDYLYNRILGLSGGASNFVGTLDTSGGLLSYTKDGTSYTLVLTTNTVRQALTNTFLSTNTTFGGAVTGKYGNLVLVADFNGVVTGKYTNLQFAVPIIDHAVFEGGILSGNLAGSTQHISLTTGALHTALADWALATNTIFDGVVTGEFSNLTFNESVDWAAFGVGDMAKSEYDADEDGRVDAVDDDSVDSAAIQDDAIAESDIQDQAIVARHLHDDLFATDLYKDGQGLGVNGLLGRDLYDPFSLPDDAYVIIATNDTWLVAPLPRGDMSKAIYDTVASGDGKVDAAMYADSAGSAVTASGLMGHPIVNGAWLSDYVLTYDAAFGVYANKSLSELGLRQYFLDEFDLDVNGVIDAADHAAEADHAATADHATTADQLLGMPVEALHNDGEVLVAMGGELQFTSIGDIPSDYMTKAAYDNDGNGAVDAVDPDSIDGASVLDESLTGDDIADGSVTSADVDGSVLTSATVFAGDAAGSYDALSVSRLRGASIPQLAASNNNKVLVFKYPNTFQFLHVENLADETGGMDIEMFESWVTNVYEVATNDLWAAINYVPIRITSFAASVPVSYEAGQSVAPGFGLTWNMSKTQATTRVLTGPSLNINLFAGGTGTYTYAGTAISNNSTFTLTVGDGTTNSSASVAFSFNRRRYAGFSSTESGLSDAEIRAFAYQPYASGRAFTQAFTPTGLQYLWVCYPTSYGAATFRLNSFPLTGWETTARTFVNASGSSNLYTIYRSPYAYDLPVTLEVQ